MEHLSSFGRILSSNIRECIIAYRAEQPENEPRLPAFGSMVKIPVGKHSELEIYGLVTDIEIEEDGFLRQLASNERVSEEVMLDARVNRNVPVVMRILFIGFAAEGRLSHMLPPRPPLTLDAIYECTPEEISAFTVEGRFAYLRHILCAADVKPGDLLAAHLQQAAACHKSQSVEKWEDQALQEIIQLMRDQANELTEVLSAIAAAGIGAGEGTHEF